MNIDQLLKYLDLETPEQFEYFENLADLVEADTEIPPETLFELFSHMDMRIFAELLQHYFEEIMDSIPDDASELYTLMDTVKMAFVGVASNVEEEKDLILLVDEFYRFRNWYSLDSKVQIEEDNPDPTARQLLPIRDALTLSRMEKLGGVKFDYYFDPALDFEMDEYTMSFADLMAEDRMELQESYEEEFN